MFKKTLQETTKGGSPQMETDDLASCNGRARSPRPISVQKDTTWIRFPDLAKADLTTRET
jgi:hypothetical protein